MTMAKAEKSHIEKLADMIVESSRGRGLYPVYSEFVATTAVAIARACGNDTSKVGAKVREQSDDDGEMPRMIAELIMAVEDAQYCDILGDLFMRLNLGSQAGGQFFTPTHLAHLCGDIAMPENKSFVSALDPACGGGAMLMAGAKKMRDDGHIPGVSYWAEGQDINEETALTCYVQLSLNGMAGRVSCGNTLAMDSWWSLLTPVAALDPLWRFRRAEGKI